MPLSRIYELSQFLQNLSGLGHSSSSEKLNSIHINKELKGIREEVVIVFFHLTIKFAVYIKIKWKQQC
jgi:hypothetical protein